MIYGVVFVSDSPRCTKMCFLVRSIVLWDLNNTQKYIFQFSEHFAFSTTSFHKMLKRSMSILSEQQHWSISNCRRPSAPMQNGPFDRPVFHCNRGHEQLVQKRLWSILKCRPILVAGLTRAANWTRDGPGVGWKGLRQGMTLTGRRGLTASQAEGSVRHSQDYFVSMRQLWL